MLCENPYQKGCLELGCGRCGSCRVNRARLWTGRMLLESFEHPFSSFITLTYDEAHHPWDGCLRKQDLQLFLKRLRSKLDSSQPIRFYGCGEYGEKTLRPHYHLIVFGLSPMQSAIVQKSWPHGFTFTGTVEPKSISYVASYVTKKLWKKQDPRMRNLVPEFQVMSNRPGIGYGVVPRLKAAADRFPMVDPLTMTTHRIQGKQYPLGRYLRGKLYELLGVTKEQKADLICTLNSAKFAEIDSTGSTTYHRIRKARIAAAHGRRIERAKPI